MAKYITQLRRGTKQEWADYEATKYTIADSYSSTATYYVDTNGTEARPQPTQSEFKSRTYYIKNPKYLAPLEGELVLEYDDNGVPRLKIGNGISDYSSLPYMSVDSFVLPTPTFITLYGNKWETDSTNTRRHTQDITEQLKGKITKRSKIDLQPTPQQLLSFYENDVTFTTVNNEGKVRVCAIGTKPDENENYENIQITITEVAIDD
jgi:hypothetical protein